MHVGTGFWRMSAIMIGLLAILQAGCEVSSEKEKVRIVPGSAALKTGESVTLRAEGGSDYGWTLENESLGMLNIRNGSTVVYTSLYKSQGGTSVVQRVTVVANPGAGNLTNIVSRTAVAYITQF